MAFDGNICHRNNWQYSYSDRPKDVDFGNVLRHEQGDVGASNSLIQWFCSYLMKDDKWFESIQYCQSPYPVTAAFSGEVYSDHFYLAYTLIDLPSAPQKCSVQSYVDDTRQVISFKMKHIGNPFADLRDYLHRIGRWSSNNLICWIQVMVFGSRPMHSRLVTPSLTFMGREPVLEHTTKDLGVILDTNNIHEKITQFWLAEKEVQFFCNTSAKCVTRVQTCNKSANYKCFLIGWKHKKN